MQFLDILFGRINHFFLGMCYI